MAKDPKIGPYQVRRMSKKTGVFIAATVFGAIWLVSLLITVPINIMLAGVSEGVLIGTLLGLVLGGAIYVALGLRINSGRTFIVVERLGKPYQVYRSGLYVLCLKGIVDKIIMEDTLEYLEVSLYNPEDGDDQIDFKDASAGIRVSAWVQIGRRNADGSAKEEEIISDVLRAAYEVKDFRGFVKKLIDADLRPLLQAMTLDEASQAAGGNRACLKVAEDSVLRRGLAKVGVHFRREQPLTLQDIRIPENIQKFREQLLEGETRGLKDAAEAAGIRRAIEAIQITETKDGEVENCSWDQAVDIFLTRLGLDTVKNAGANVTFVSKDVRNMLLTLGVNQGATS